MLKTSTLPALSGLLVLAQAAHAQPQMPTFAAATLYAAGPISAPASVVLADVNKDSKPDILLADANGSTAGVLLGSGNGTFQPVVSYATGTGSWRPLSLAVADVNADGNADLLVANASSSTAGVLLGNGNGTFRTAANYSTGLSTSPMGIAVADVNADGYPDLLTANYSNNTVSVLTSNGNGTFQPIGNLGLTGLYPSGGSNPRKIVAADVNGDGRPDLLVAHAQGATVSVLLNTSAAGTFQTAVSYLASPGNSVSGLAVADVNNDGKLDLVATDSDYGVVGVLNGNGNGTFQAVSTYRPGSLATPVGVTVADLNGDRKPDLVVANPSEGKASVLLNYGAGIFQSSTAAYSAGPSAGAATQPLDVAAADLNADGRPDLVTANYSTGTVSVLLNTTPLATRAALPGATATLSPNPATTAATLSLTGLPAAVTQMQATLLNATGRAVARQVVAAGQGAARAELPTAKLAAGFYVLHLEALDAQGQLVGSLPAQRLSIQ